MKSKAAASAVLVIALFLGGYQRNDETTATESVTTEDCKQDFDCFIHASQSCSPATLISETTLDFFGMKQTTVSLFEIRGVTDGNRCALYMRTEKNDIEFPAGTPSEVVSEQKAIAKKLEGRDAICKFATADLTAMLTRWKEGELSTEDLRVAESEGRIFSPDPGVFNLLSDLCSSHSVCDTRLMSTPPTHRYKPPRFPAEIIGHGVWLYFRFCLSYRDVEELLFARGVMVTYEAIRKWCRKFGQQYANQLRRWRPGRAISGTSMRCSSAFSGERHYLWRAVDQDGNVLDILVQRRRDKHAAKKFFRKLLKG